MDTASVRGSLVIQRVLTYQERLQGHTEVLSMILGHAHRTAILSCLQVNKRYHSLAFQHIDTVYEHVFIDRDTVDSVFEGIDSALIEKRWKQHDWHNESNAFSGEDSVEESDEHSGPESTLRDRSANLRKKQLLIRKYPAVKANQQPGAMSPAHLELPPTFGPGRSDQHWRKRYSLSRCRLLTLSDAWKEGDERNRCSSHLILDNGRAHYLFPAVRTIRTMPPFTAKSGESSPICTGEDMLCSFWGEILPSKVVYRNAVTCVDDNDRLGSLKEAVYFLPIQGWPGDTGRYHPNGKLESCKIVLGVRARKTGYSVYWGTRGLRGETCKTRADLPRLLDALSPCISSASERVEIYGIERAEVVEDDQYHPNVDQPEEIQIYDAITLQRKIEDFAQGNDRYNQIPSSRQLSFHTIEEYIATNPDDELFEHELHPPTDPSEWWISQYWTPKENWMKYPPVPGVGELERVTTFITDE